MAVTDQLFTLWSGNRRIIEFTVEDEDNPGNPLSLTGYVVKFALARFDRNGDPIKANPLIDMRSDTSSQVTITDAANGVVEVELLEADTVNIQPTPGDYYFELEVFDVSNNSVVVATGTATIKRNVDNA